MEILFSDSAISKVNADLVAVVVCAKDDAWLSELDDMLGGHLLEWCTAQHFRGERGSSIVVPTLGHISSKALVLIGAGTSPPGPGSRFTPSSASSSLGLSSPE